MLSYAGIICKEASNEISLFYFYFNMPQSLKGFMKMLINKKNNSFNRK